MTLLKPYSDIKDDTAMQKHLVFILILLSFIIILPAYCGNSELLSKIETSFYGFDYSKDNLQNRVLRLEKTIYGKNSSGDINKRIKRLSGDISADVIGFEITPVKDTFLAAEEADNTVQYPIVDEIEQKLFKKTYPNRDFHTRIVTIEKKLFGKIYDVDDYSKRMDRIKSKIMPETIVENRFDEYGNGKFYDDNAINSIDLSGTSQSRFANPFGQRNYTRHYINYGNLEDEYINSKSKNLDEDLAQMEYDMFGTEFSNESTQSRIKRLNSVNKAKKSSRKYDSQKFSQHMSTAMEIGAMILMVLAMIL